MEYYLLSKHAESKGWLFKCKLNRCFSYSQPNDGIHIYITLLTMITLLRIVSKIFESIDFYLLELKFYHVFYDNDHPI